MAAPQCAALVVTGRFSGRFRGAGAWLLAILLLLPLGAHAADARLEQLQALEHELLVERDALLAEIGDPNRIFVQAPEGGGILTFDRAALGRIVGAIAFLAVEDDLAARVAPMLPARIRSVIAVAQSLGMWNEAMIAGRVLDEIGRRSDATRLEARRRVHAEYDPLIEEVRAAAAGLDGDAATAGDPCANIPGLWSWFINGDVTFHEGGTLVQGPRTGTWTCSGTDVVLVWNHGFTDELTISADGLAMSGANQNQTGVSGQKIGDAD